MATGTHKQEWAKFTVGFCVAFDHVFTFYQYLENWSQIVLNYFQLSSKLI